MSAGPAPFGMRWQDGKLVPQPAEGGVVVELVEAFIAKSGRMKATAAAMNAMGFRTRRGGPWTDVAVSRVLEQERLRDMVAESLWRRCEELLAEREARGRGPGRRSTHPLGGVVRCRPCGGRMYLRGDGPAGKFVCQGCRSKIPYETFEGKFMESLASVMVTRQEVVNELQEDSRAAEVARVVGERGVSIAEIWPSLDAAERRQLVDVLVARVEVREDEIRVILAVSEHFQAETEASQPHSSPISHDFRTRRQTATRQVDSLRVRQDGEVELDLPSQDPGPEPKAYRIHQVARLLSVPKSTAYDLVRTGALASIHTGTRNGGRMVLVPASAVSDFLETKRRRR